MPRPRATPKPRPTKRPSNKARHTSRPRSPADTVGPRHQIRLNASFWFGLSSVLTLGKPYQDMVKSKKCDQAKAIHDRLVRTRAALLYGERVHPPTARQMLGYLTQYEQQMPKVKQAFKCRNF